jgi:histone H2A
MSSAGKGSAKEPAVGDDPKGKGKGKRPGKTKSFRAGLTFPVGRFMRLIKKEGSMKRVSPDAAVAMAGALEYLCEELVNVGDIMIKDKRIKPRHIALKTYGDADLSKFFGTNSIAAGGVLPNIHAVLLPKDKKTKGESKPKKKITGKKTKRK